MEQLRRNARPGSSLVFLCKHRPLCEHDQVLNESIFLLDSGHGDQVPTEVSEIEPDGLDEGTLPHTITYLLDKLSDFSYS